MHKSSLLVAAALAGLVVLGGCVSDEDFASVKTTAGQAAQTAQAAMDKANSNERRIGALEQTVGGLDASVRQAAADAAAASAAAKEAADKAAQVYSRNLRK